MNFCFENASCAQRIYEYIITQSGCVLPEPHHTHAWLIQHEMPDDVEQHPRVVSVHSVTVDVTDESKSYGPSLCLKFTPDSGKARVDHYIADTGFCESGTHKLEFTPSVEYNDRRLYLLHFDTIRERDSTYARVRELRKRSKDRQQQQQGLRPTGIDSAAVYMRDEFELPHTYDVWVQAQPPTPTDAAGECDTDAGYQCTAGAWLCWRPRTVDASQVATIQVTSDIIWMAQTHGSRVLQVRLCVTIDTC